MKVTSRILIVNTDKALAARLKQAVSTAGPFAVTVMDSAKKASLHLAQRRQDLAFIPVVNGDKIMRALRAVQSDLRLILVTPTADFELLPEFAGSVQGVLLEPLLDVELLAVLQKAWAQPWPVSGSATDQTEETIKSLDTAVLVAALSQARLGRLLQSVVFARGPNLLAYWGELREREAATIALSVGIEWPDEGQPRSRVQFIHLPAHAGDLILYTHQVAADYLLTLVGLPETPLSELRLQAKQMVHNLHKVVLGKTGPPTLPDDEANGILARRTSYALVWQAVQPLPASLHIPLRRAIERLAVVNGCVLTHIQVRAELVHLVASCPPGRDSAWAAYLFKSGSEQIIQQQYGVPANLWETGFYAAESADPLSEAELNLFLEHDFA